MLAAFNDHVDAVGCCAALLHGAERDKECNQPNVDQLRRWVDADTGEIAAHLATDGHADDAAQVSDLLRQPEGVIASVIADGAYDGIAAMEACCGAHHLGRALLDQGHQVRLMSPE